MRGGFLIQGVGLRPRTPRRHVLHIVRIRLTANARSFRRSAFPQPAHVVGPGRGPRAWQGLQSAPGLVLGGSANVPPALRGGNGPMRASAPTGAQQKRQRSPLTVWPMASHLLQGDVPELTLPGFAPRGDTSNKGARRPPCAWSLRVGFVKGRGSRNPLPLTVLWALSHMRKCHALRGPQARFGAQPPHSGGALGVLRFHGDGAVLLLVLLQIALHGDAQLHID